MCFLEEIARRSEEDPTSSCAFVVSLSLSLSLSLGSLSL